MRLIFPTSDGSYLSYEKLAHIWLRALHAAYGSVIVLDFSKCNRLGPFGLVILAGIYRTLRARRLPCTIAIETMSEHVYARFLESGCAYHLIQVPKNPHALFRHDLIENHDAIIKFLKEEWLASANITMSELLRNEFISRLWEVYANAFEHGDSQHGVYTCGERADDDTLLLTVADFGRGIPANAATNLGRTYVSGEEALNWAFTRGTTTVVNQRYPRGLGLDLIKDFVRLNDGSVEIFSHHGHGIVTKMEDRFRSLLPWISATVVQMRIRCDNMHYMFTSELSEQFAASSTPVF